MPKYPVFGELFSKCKEDRRYPSDEEFDEAVQNAGLTYDSQVPVDFVYYEAELVLKEKPKKNTLPLEKYHLTKMHELVSEPQVRLLTVLELKNDICDYFYD
jgi:hypothetical protein